MADARVDEAGRPAPSASGPPQGTLTFLLTDVEGSSRLWEGDRSDASAALDRREEIIHEATSRHGGVLPLEQGEGDSTVSVFIRASDAVGCAVDIQRMLAAEAWPDGVVIRVRIALHTGEADLRPDGTYRGPAINRCARLRDIAHGGQILVSHASHEVLVDGLSDAVVLRDLGVHRLRDLARPERVHQLSAPDFADAFPPLRSLDAVANNLPIQLTSFVGRDAEGDALADLLSEHRLVTLTGAGGCGKTRLALQVATRLADDHPDGVWWVDLAPLADPALVPAALAAALGVREAPIEPITDTVVAHLAGRRAVVGLDNCEHLIEACAALAARLVQGCPRVTLLATSRELLGVEGETTFRVPPLSLPDEGATDSETQSEAMRLFIDRARASRPDFALTEDSAPAAAEICTRLDGIPLAIELAAARTRLLTVNQIAAGLADRFHLLTGGTRSALPRQRTLEGSVHWSHDLLDGTERAVFRRLAVFAGSFTLDAAEAVCGADGVPPDAVLDLLSALVDRSLVQVVEQAGPHTRYRLLETIRDFARHRLIDAGEVDTARDGHLDFYVSFAREAAAGLEGPDLIAWLTRIDGELDNVRAALDASPRSADPDQGLRLVELLHLYWFARSELGIGRGRLESTVADASGNGRDRANALSALCMVSYRAGEMDKSARYGDEAIAIGRRLADPVTLGRALHWRAWTRYWGEGDRFAAWADFEEAAGLLRETNDHVFAALNLALLGWSYVTTSEAPRARTALVEGLALAEVNQAPHARCYCRAVLGYLDTLEGHFDRAAAHLREAVPLAEAIGDQYIEIFARCFISILELYRGRYREARHQAERGLARAVEHRNPNGEASMRLVLGTVSFAEARLEAAAGELDASFEIHVMPQVAALCRHTQALVAAARSLPAEALQYAEDARTMAEETDTVLAVVGALTVQASLARLDGNAHEAEDLLHDALDLASGIGARPAVCEALEDLAGAVADQGRFEEAGRLLGAAQSLRDAIGHPRYPVYAASHDTDTALVRGALDAGAFDDVWAEGAALSFADAVTYARRGRGQRKRPTQGWNSLTPTEDQVVGLVAEGLTNPQIGERLFISKRTVQAHLSHVFAKLGVSTRAELAAKAAQRQAADP